MINTHPTVIVGASRAFAVLARVRSWWPKAQDIGATWSTYSRQAVYPPISGRRRHHLSTSISMKSAPCHSGADLRDDSLLLPVEVLKSDFVVSMAKLKTHHWSGMTAAMKNLFGVVPVRCTAGRRTCCIFAGSTIPSLT